MAVGKPSIWISFLRSSIGQRITSEAFAIRSSWGFADRCLPKLRNILVIKKFISGEKRKPTDLDAYVEALVYPWGNFTGR